MKKNNTPLSIEEAIEMLEAGLPIQVDPIPFTSDLAQYIYDHYKPIGTDQYDDPLFNDSETETMAALLRGLPHEDLEQLHEALYGTPLSWRINSVLYDTPNIEQRQKKALSIATLINHYSKGIKGKKAPARWSLQSRFPYQSYTDQMKIMRLFLDGSKVDRNWCYRTLQNWWDEALIPDLERTWIKYHDAQCVRVAAKRLPESFIKEQQESMGELDYKSVCLRLASDPDYVIDRTRLGGTDYCFVIAHNHRHISDDEADQLLIGEIEKLLEFKLFPTLTHFRTYRSTINYERLEDKMLYRPSLLFYRPISYVIWSLGQTNNTNTILKFHQWDKNLQDNMPKHLVEKMSKEDQLSMMKNDFHAYQQWNWDIYAEQVRQALPRFKETKVVIERKRKGLYF